MKILMTAFEPFGGEPINPSSLILEKLPQKIGKLELVKMLLPVTFYESSRLLTEAIDTHQPDFVLSLGQAGGRATLTIEKIGININEAPIPDNAGHQPHNERISIDQADGFFTTLPIQNMLNASLKAGVPCQISYSAGTYVCNHVMYASLAYINSKQLNIRSGFVHIPYLPEQVLNKANQPSMSLEQMIEGIHAMLSSLESPDAISSPLSSAGYTH